MHAIQMLKKILSTFFCGQDKRSVDTILLAAHEAEADELIAAVGIALLTPENV